MLAEQQVPAVHGTGYADTQDTAGRHPLVRQLVERCRAG